ncbi:MAG: type II secretion system F family protein [Myxococcales bacterium]|nr:type II secretion system F family protein [Myxococcales bacterium]
MNAHSAAVHTWFSALARLLGAGLPLTEALRQLADAAPTSALRRASDELARAIDAGVSFSDAMARRPKLFPLSVRLAVRVAGPVGGLRETLTAAADVYAADAGSRLILRGVWFYAATLVAMLFVVTGYVPRAVWLPLDWVEGNAGIWPWDTVLPAAARWAVAALLVAVGLLSVLGHVRLGAQLDRAKLAVPLLGESLRVALLAPALTLVGVLLRRGVGMGAALRESAASIQNDYLKRELLEVVELERSGRCTTKALRPLERLSLVAAWRRSELDAALDDVAIAMRLRLRQRSVGLVRWFGPLVILLLGAILYDSWAGGFFE